ncbi:hypothetical protein [Nitrosomonas sp.]|nr:hypothetical protein [Nitrosomonas sp.]
MEDIIKVLELKILPLTPVIAGLAESCFVSHKVRATESLLQQR